MSNPSKKHDRLKSKYKGIYEITSSNSEDEQRDTGINIHKHPDIKGNMLQETNVNNLDRTVFIFEIINDKNILFTNLLSYHTGFLKPI